MDSTPEAILVVEGGLDDVSVIPLDTRQCVLGKAPPASILLDNPYISRQHAQIRRLKGQYLIRDLKSKNGTFINGSKLGTSERRLRNGDRIELAKGQVTLRFQGWGTTVTLPAIGKSGGNDLEVDARARDVFLQGKKVAPPLSRKEFDVLHLLYQKRGEACNKDSIAQSGWPERQGGDVGDQEIEQCVRRLRLRIEPDPSTPQYLITVRGFGYKLAG